MSEHVRGFEWDSGNMDKNLKHGVTDEEAEETFFNRHKVSKSKFNRYALFGVTNSGRYLTIIFQRKPGNIVRIISARDMTDKERKYYKR